MVNPAGNNTNNPHDFSNRDLTLPPPGGPAHPLLSLPNEVLDAITEYVATGSRGTEYSTQEAAANAIQWGRVSCKPHLATHELHVADLLNRAEHEKYLDEALVIMWNQGITRQLGRNAPQIATAREIRDWMTDPNNVLLLGAVRKITLNGCGLKVIPPEINNLRNLQGLELNGNQITQIPPQAFAGCPALRILSLDNNQIAQIGPQAFVGCLALASLSLNNNRIAQINPQAFAGCPALRILFLVNNRIAQIGPQAFVGCLALESLYLGNNQIAQFNPRTLAGCPVLQCLSFFSNPVLYNFSACDSLNEFNAFSGYACRSAWANFYKAVSEDTLPTVAFPGHLSQLEDRNLVYEMVYLEAKAAAEQEGQAFSTEGDDQWGEHHVCDNMAIFFRALQRSVQEKFSRLSDDQQRAVHGRIYAIAREDAGLAPDAPEWDDPDWGRTHREDNVLRLIDAMAGF